MSPRPVPVITHLQFLLLDACRARPRRGRHLRRTLERRGIRRTAPAFYQLMARLEDAGLIIGEYDQKIVDGQIIKERRYTVTAAGLAEWQATREFYAESLAAPEAPVATSRRRKRPAHA
jgi:DNA-binding PadR family transcriptional regulator